MEKREVSKQQLEKALRSAKSSLEIEGFVVTQEVEALIEKKFNGEIDEFEFNQKMLQF